MRKKNKRIVKKNLKKEKLKSIPMPSISMEELEEAAACAQACADYPGYNPGDNTLNGNK